MSELSEHVVASTKELAARYDALCRAHGEVTKQNIKLKEQLAGQGRVIESLKQQLAKVVI